MSTFIRRKQPLVSRAFLLFVLFTNSAAVAEPAARATPQSTVPTPSIQQRENANNWQSKVTRAECEEALNQVDKLVEKEFYDVNLVKDVWHKSRDAHKQAILKSENLKQLAENMNAALHELKCSHTQFVTRNEEIFYFLQSLFSNFNNKLPAYKMDFIGITTGGVDKSFDCIRYVLDGSPAQKAGLRRGDIIESVNGAPYEGQATFHALSGKKVTIKIRRGTQRISVLVEPKFEADYPQYVKAIDESKALIPSPVGNLGYVHYWSGGRPSLEVFESTVLSEKMLSAEGLIIDLRDGYGANSLTDLDLLYRPEKAFPKMTTISRSGEQRTSQDYYDKPVVVLINRGSRSGKELLASALKNSGRAKLIGETTAGYVLAGRLFPINNRMSLYLAVDDIYLNGVRIEGKGVSPDIVVPDDSDHPNGYEDQLEVAKKTLVEEIEKHRQGNPKTTSTVEQTVK
ncbi:MAG TPA: S41 family peptidase [Oculatellaceae cyanobacterium]